VKTVVVQGNIKNVTPLVVGSDSLVFAPIEPSWVSDKKGRFVNTSTTPDVNIIAEMLEAISNMALTDKLYVYMGGRDGWPKMAFGLAQVSKPSQYYYRWVSGYYRGVRLKIAEKLLGKKVQDGDEPPAA